MRKNQNLVSKKVLYDLMIKNIERLDKVAQAILHEKPPIEDNIVFLLVRTMSDVTKLYYHQQNIDQLLNCENFEK